MFTARVLLNKEYSSNGYTLKMAHGLHDYSVFISHPHLLRESDGSRFKKVYSFSRSSSARDFVRNFINSALSRQQKFFDSDAIDLPSPLLSQGAPLGNQNAKKERTVKIQFRLDDVQLIEFLENYSPGMSINDAAREMIIEGMLFKTIKKIKK